MCYFGFVKEKWDLRGFGWMAAAVVAGLMLVASAFVSRADAANNYTPILHPTIFWHDNQWETYEKGQWVPYHESARNNIATEAEREEVVIPEEPQAPEVVETNGFVPGYGWGFIGAPAFYRPHHHRLAHTRPEHRRPGTGMGRRYVGPGQTTIGIGKPNAGIGQTTIGIGRLNAGLGRTTIGLGQNNAGIGQTTIGIGQPNAGVGRANAGVGQTTIGIGQPNAGVGQPTVGMGQNNAGLGQPTVGIGQPTIGIGQQMGSSRGGWGDRKSTRL